MGCHFLLQCMKMKTESEVAQSCPILSDLMDFSPLGSSIHGIFQARVLEWGAIAFSDTALTYSFSYLEPVCCSMSSSNCCFLTCIQMSQEAGQVVWYSHLLKNFPVYCDPHSQRLWHSQESRNRCFSGTLFLLHDPADVGNLIFGSSAFSKTSLNIWKFMVHVFLKPGLENFEHYFTSLHLAY